MNVSLGNVGDIGERAVIDRIRARLAPPPAWVAIGIGDDAAVLRPERNRSEVITTDVLVEGVHFDRSFVPPVAIGHKALAVNLSDLAAMGAEPRAALLSLVLPADLGVGDLDAILEGLLALAGRHGVSLVGGNVARSPGPLIVDITATGVVKPRQALARSAARAGDDLYVSGQIGTAAAGLALRRSKAGQRAALDSPVEGCEDSAAACERRFLMPEPRVRLGQLLSRAGVATSCVDLSDGLGDGVRQLGWASRVGAIVEADVLPVLEAARAALGGKSGNGWLEAAIAGGEDYELLFTVSPKRRRALQAVLQHAQGVTCTKIGRITRDRRVVLRRATGDEALPGGFAHFQ